MGTINVRLNANAAPRAKICARCEIDDFKMLESGVRHGYGVTDIWLPIFLVHLWTESRLLWRPVSRF